MSESTCFDVITNLVARLVQEVRLAEELRGNAVLRDREVSYEADITSLNKTISQLEDTERDLRERIDDFHQSTTELEYRIDQLESELDSARLSSTQKDVQITDLEHRIVELEARRDSLVFENHDLQARIDRENGIFAAYRQETDKILDELRTRVSELEDQLESERKVNAAWVTSSTLKDTIIADLRNINDEYSYRINEDAATITDLRAKTNDLESQNDHLYKRVVALEEQLASLPTPVTDESPVAEDSPFRLEVFPLRDIGIKIGHRYRTRDGRTVEIYEVYDRPSNYHFRGRYTSLTNCESFWTKEGSYYSLDSDDFKPDGDSDDLVTYLGPSYSSNAASPE